MAKPKILIVDDESNTSILIQNMLEELGYNVVSLASSGKEAIQKTLQIQPDLVLMDIILEGEMDGVDAARQIHDSLDIPIVYLTGHADDGLLHRAKLTEPYGYIIKPFDESELRTTIEIALYRHKMEKLLKESGKRYKAVCELTSDYIFHINISKDKQMLFDWITEGFAPLTGYTISEVNSPELWNKIFHPDDISRVDGALKNLIQGNEEKHECRIITKGGETLWLIVNMQSEWDAKKQNVIGIIGAVSNITERKKADEQIKASLKEKDVLLDEVHHRVKNNLQIISSLLDMSSMKTQNQEAIALFEESRNRVNAMAIIHSQLYESERFDRIDMGRHIQELSGNLLNIYSKEQTITLDIKSANVYLPVTQAVPCALVLNELISNSLKHAYRDGQKGTMSITMQQSNDGTTLLKVQDDGLGIPENIDIGWVKSLGLKLVRNIVYKQLNGKIRIIRNKGTEFIIEFTNFKEEV
jgi:PAS domain S-box-containing protein